jgi:hypothetical protein
VRQVAGFPLRARHAPFAVLEQAVEVVDERLELAGVAAQEPRLFAVAHRIQAGAQLGEQRQARTHLQQARRQQAERERPHRDVVDDAARVVPQKMSRRRVEHDRQPDRPQQGCHDQPPAQRSHSAAGMR